MKQLIEVVRVHALHRFGAADQSLIDHVPRDPHRGGRGPLAGPRLQQEQLPALDGELQVLHVAVMPLEPFLHGQQLGVGAGQPSRHFVDVERGANAGHDILALRVHQELAVESALARGRVPREGDASAGIVTHVAEHHRHDVHAGSQVVGDPVHLAVVDGLLERPGSPHGLDGSPELRRRIHREIGPGHAADERLVLGSQGSQRRLGELTIRFHATEQAFRGQEGLEARRGDVEHDVTVHLEEPAVRIPGKPSVPAQRRQTFDRRVVEAEVEDRLHHSRHGDRGTAADGNKQRIRRVPEALAGRFLELLQVLRDPLTERGRHTARCEVRHAGTAGDREAWWDGHAEVRHLGQVGPLGAQHALHLARAVRASVTEEVDESRCWHA